MEQIHYIENKRVDNPINFADLSLEIIFDNDSVDRSASITTYEWVGKSADLLKQIKDTGLSGGKGITYGVLHRIELHENGIIETLPDRYIDLMTATYGSNEYGQSYVSADSLPKNQLDWINEVADGFSMESLYNDGKLSKLDVVNVPYVISSIPNYTEAFLVIVTLTFVAIELKKVISDLIESTAKTAGYISSISGIIQLIFKIIYAILLLVTIVELILDMAALIIQKIKYKPSMSWLRQLQVGCEHLGLTFRSPILEDDTWSRAYIIPETFRNVEALSDSRIKGWFTPNNDEQKGYFRGTFGDLIREAKKAFNARVVISDKEVKLLPRLKTGTANTFTLPNHDNKEFRLNADKIVSNYIVSLPYDASDGNTIDNYEGNVSQATLKPVVHGDPSLALMKGFEQVQIKFSRGISKTEFTAVENIVDDIFDSLDPVIGSLVKIGNGGIKIINAIFKAINDLNDKLSIIGIEIDLDLPEYSPLENPNLGELIDNRRRMLSLEKDFFTNPKLVLLDVNDDYTKTKLSTDNQEKVNAEYLLLNYHQSKLFNPSPESAQRYLYDYQSVELNLKQFQQIVIEGLAKLPDGSDVDITSCKWNPATRLAEFKIEKRELYTNNIALDISTPTGS